MQSDTNKSKHDDHHLHMSLLTVVTNISAYFEPASFKGYNDTQTSSQAKKALREARHRQHSGSKLTRNY